MALTYTDLYPLLEKKGWSSEEAHQFIKVLENRATENLATREDLSKLEARIYRAMLIQTGIIIGGVAALVKLL